MLRENRPTCPRCAEVVDSTNIVRPYATKKDIKLCQLVGAAYPPRLVFCKACGADLFLGLDGKWIWNELLCEKFT